MKLITPACILIAMFSTFTHAFNLDFQNGRVEFSDIDGQASFDRLFVREKSFEFEQGDFKADIKKSERALTFSFDQTRFALKGEMFESLKDYHSLNLDLRQMVSNEKELTLDAPYLLISGKDHYDLKELNAECFGETTPEDPYQFLVLCLNDATIAAKEGAFSKESFIPKIFSQVEGLDVMSSVNKLYNLFITISEGNISMKLKVKKGLEVKVKITAFASFDRPNGLLTIHLKKAKAALFSIKKEILEELKKNESEGFWIKGDHLYIKM